MSIEANIKAITESLEKIATCQALLVKLLGSLPVIANAANEIAGTPGAKITTSAKTVDTEKEDDGTSPDPEPKKKTRASKPKEEPKIVPGPDTSEPATESEQYVKTDVRAALMEVQSIMDAAAARDLLKASGAKSLTELDPEKYGEVIAAAQEIIDASA